MAFEIPSTEPTEIRVGDRIKWTKSLPAYPATAEGWTLTYYLRANQSAADITITAAADGDKFAVDVPITTSQTWIPGGYWWESYVSKSGERHKVGEGQMSIKADFATLPAPYDGRTHARIALDAIEAVLENRASKDQLNYTVQAAGRSVSKIPHADLIAFRQFYRAEVAAEETAAKLARGENSGKNIFVRFGRP